MKKVKVTYRKNRRWFLLAILVIISIYFFMDSRRIFIWFLSKKESIAIVSDIISSIAFVGVIYAIWDINARRYESKRQIIIALNNQLDNIENWIKGPNGKGWKPSKSKEEESRRVRTWSNPRHSVNEIDITGLQILV